MAWLLSLSDEHVLYLHIAIIYAALFQILLVSDIVPKGQKIDTAVMTFVGRMSIERLRVKMKTVGA